MAPPRFRAARGGDGEQRQEARAARWGEKAADFPGARVQTSRTGPLHCEQMDLDLMSKGTREGPGRTGPRHAPTQQTSQTSGIACSGFFFAFLNTFHFEILSDPQRWGMMCRGSGHPPHGGAPLAQCPLAHKRLLQFRGLTWPGTSPSIIISAACSALRRTKHPGFPRDWMGLRVWGRDVSEDSAGQRGRAGVRPQCPWADIL